MPIDAMPIDAMPIDAMPIDAMPIDAPPGCVVPAFTTGVSTLAGCEIAAAIDGARPDARFANPVNVALGPDGKVYVADFDSGRIRTVTADGTVATLVQQANFQRPFGLAFAADGTLYVSTDDNDSLVHSTMTGTIWRVDTTTGAATVVIRDIGRPRGIAVLPEPDGRIVLSDYLHHTVRLLDPDTPAITDLAGLFDTPGFADLNGADARLDGPYGVALLSDGRIAVADLFNHRIRAIELDGDVTTLAGTGAIGSTNGAAASATFAYPQDLAVDAADNLYISDMENYVVRKLASGQVSTAVGSGTAGWLDSDDLLAAQLHGLEGIDVAAGGATLWIADGSRGEPLPYHRVRVVDLDGP
jgi:DNA-binding beta-propeller fold protein YncE